MRSVIIVNTHDVSDPPCTPVSSYPRDGRPRESQTMAEKRHAFFHLHACSMRLARIRFCSMLQMAIRRGTAQACMMPGHWKQKTSSKTESRADEANRLN